MASKGQMTGVLGTNLAAAELTHKDLVVSITSRNAREADLLVTDRAYKKTWSIQVKTNRKAASFWLLSKDYTELVSRRIGHSGRSSWVPFPRGEQRRSNGVSIGCNRAAAAFSLVRARSSRTLVPRRYGFPARRPPAGGAVSGKTPRIGVCAAGWVLRLDSYSVSNGRVGIVAAL
jgi:hypothetical protein